jgi:hypothetical protein
MQNSQPALDERLAQVGSSFGGLRQKWASGCVAYAKRPRFALGKANGVTFLRASEPLRFCAGKWAHRGPGRR